MSQASRDTGAEAIIIGEMSKFIVIASLGMSLPVIESLHSVSEIPAIRTKSNMMKEKLPDLPTHYVPSGIRIFSKKFGKKTRGLFSIEWDKSK